MTRRRKRASETNVSSKSDPSKQQEAQSTKDDASELAAIVRRHQWLGWRALFLFLLLGLALEGLHAFKVGWYLDFSNTTRRHMWTLAHAHGTLLAALNLIFAATVPLVPGWSHRKRNLASACLLSASVLLPAGFFLGGWVTYGGDPGVGITLVPVGGILLLTAVALAGRG